MVGVLTDKNQLPETPRTAVAAPQAAGDRPARARRPRATRSTARTLTIDLTAGQLQRLLERRSSGASPSEVVLYQDGRRVAVLEVSRARFLA